MLNDTNKQAKTYAWHVTKMQRCKRSEETTQGGTK